MEPGTMEWPSPCSASNQVQRGETHGAIGTTMKAPILLAVPFDAVDANLRPGARSFGTPPSDTLMEWSTPMIIRSSVAVLPASVQAAWRSW